MPSVQSTTTDDDFESQGRVNRSLLRTNICARTGADGCSNRERPWPTALVLEVFWQYAGGRTGPFCMSTAGGGQDVLQLQHAPKTPVAPRLRGLGSRALQPRQVPLHLVVFQTSEMLCTLVLSQLATIALQEERRVICSKF